MLTRPRRNIHYLRTLPSYRTTSNTTLIDKGHCQKRGCNKGGHAYLPVEKSLIICRCNYYFFRFRRGSSSSINMYTGVVHEQAAGANEPMTVPATMHV